MLNFELTDEDRRWLLRRARSAIEGEVRGTQLAQARLLDLSDPLKSATGIFVTIREEGELRGCIGNIRSTLPLFRGVEEAARSAAVRDPRFSPLTTAELEKVDLEISVLSPFELVADPATIVAGRDGLLIQRAFYSGLLLPQVATEHGWDRDELLRWTCRKAGLPLDAWRDPATRIEKFTADVFDEKLLSSQ